jgi:hypothetical protein
LYRWIKKFDIQMRAAKRQICLLIDNFSGHNISYEPHNIQLEYFEPNLTSFVQPLDAGVIRCFKAHYRHAFCIRALDLDDAGERDIYKVNLLEAMLMAKEAWAAVEHSTIKHCWDHTEIQANHTTQDPPPSDLTSPCNDTTAWTIIREFATIDKISLPQAETRLQEHLGERYVDSDWRPALAAVMAAEGDVTAALDAIGKLASTSCPPRLTIKIPARPKNSAPQVTTLEKDLMDSVAELHKRRRIIGKPPSLEDLLDPIEEKEVEDSPYRFEGGDAEIVAEVHHQMAVEHGEIIEVDSEDEDGGEEEEEVSIGEMIRHCQQLEGLCIKYGAVESSLDLS